MILEQMYLSCLAQASYLIVDEKTKQAVVVDPRRDIDVYLEAAEKLGAKIEHVILTHFHADFLAGHLGLRDRCGATIHLGASAEAQFGFEPMKDGGSLELGDVRLEFMETPGHTPESVSILVFDAARDAERPYAVLTGDTLFIGDVGRPDLMASIGITAVELAGQLYDSLHGKLLPLPDDTIVYPGHGAGSMCGKNLSTDTSSTIGQQRKTNYALQSMSREDFVGLVTANQPDAPAYFAYDALLNRSEHRSLDEVLRESLRPFSLEFVLRLQNKGAQILDTRPAESFADGHLAGAVNIGLDGRYATWAGTVLDKDHSIVVVADPGEEEESIKRLGRIGFDRVQGYLENGTKGLEPRPELRLTHVRLSPAELRSRLSGERPPQVVDVRTPGEWDEEHIEEALLIPLSRLARELDRLPRDREIVCICKTGYRSSIAASLMVNAGYEVVTDVEGGMDAWLGKTSTSEACSA